MAPGFQCTTPTGIVEEQVEFSDSALLHRLEGADDGAVVGRVQRDGRRLVALLQQRREVLGPVRGAARGQHLGRAGWCQAEIWSGEGGREEWGYLETLR